MKIVTIVLMAISLINLAMLVLIGYGFIVPIYMTEMTFLHVALAILPLPVIPALIME